MNNDQDDLITVCDQCFMAICWHGEMMCWESENAGTIEKTRYELDQLHLEHPSNYSDEKLRKMGIKGPLHLTLHLK